MRQRKHQRIGARPPKLTIRQILGWADAYYERTGTWPHNDSRFVYGAIGEKWVNIDQALRIGLRGLPGKSTLARLLAEHRGVRNRKGLPPFDPKQIAAWADAYYQRHQRWPKHDSGAIPEAPGETWCAVQNALRAGLRGLPGGSSLARFLARYRGARNRGQLPPFTYSKILAWADAFHRRMGTWPTSDSGPIADAQGETWIAVAMALRQGNRGLPGGDTLARLLEKYRNVRNLYNLPSLSYSQILAWADAYHAHQGKWPNPDSGPIAGAPGEQWSAVNTALLAGLRGLPGGSSLAQLLWARRRVRKSGCLPRLSAEQVLRWADAFQRKHGHWPRRKSGPIPGAPADTWMSVDHALRYGYRGFRGGSSLLRFLKKHRRIDSGPRALTVGDRT